MMTHTQHVLTVAAVGVSLAAAFREAGMPELSRFFGIIIRMYVEVGGPHHLAHFHAY